MLLEGLPAEQLARLGHEDNLSELKALVATVSKFLEIHRLGLASIDVLSERELSQLDFLVATAVSCLLMLLLAFPLAYFHPVSTFTKSLLALIVDAVQEETILHASSPHRANACWALADISMEAAWRVEVFVRRFLSFHDGQNRLLFTEAPLRTMIPRSAGDKIFFGT